MALWRAALDRTCLFITQDGFSDRSVRFLFLLVRAGLAKWAGKAHLPKAKEVLAVYPFLSGQLAEEVRGGLMSVAAFTPREQQQARTLSVKRHIEDGQLSKAAKTFLVD